MSSKFDTRVRVESLGTDVFLAANATLLGDVTLGDRCSIWFQAVVRGDTEAIRIGSDTNIQDAAILHADAGFPCVLGERVTVGHAAIVHGAQVEDEVMIGMRAVILNGARIGRGSIIGAGALVTEGDMIAPNSLVFGVPGKCVRETTIEQRERIRRTAQHYVEAGRAFRSTNWGRIPG